MPTGTAATAAASCVREFAFPIATDFSKVEEARIASPGIVCILDSGASRHFEPDWAKFTTFRSIVPVPVVSADGCEFYATGEGTVPIEFSGPNDTVQIALQDVLYAQEMPIGLISISAMVKGGYKAHFETQGCRILSPKGELVITIPEKNGLCPLGPASQTAKTSMTVLSASIMKMMLCDFHSRMGHTNGPELKRMISKGIVTGVELTDLEMPQCPSCIAGKHAESPSQRII
jgi:hypothetical protein